MVQPKPKLTNPINDDFFRIIPQIPSHLKLRLYLKNQITMLSGLASCSFYLAFSSGIIFPPIAITLISIIIISNVIYSLWDNIIDSPPALFLKHVYRFLVPRPVRRWISKLSVLLDRLTGTQKAILEVPVKDQKYPLVLRGQKFTLNYIKNNILNIAPSGSLKLRSTKRSRGEFCDHQKVRYSKKNKIFEIDVDMYGKSYIEHIIISESVDPLQNSENPQNSRTLEFLEKLRKHSGVTIKGGRELSGFIS